MRCIAPVIAVTGMAFEAKIARGRGVEAVYAARADWLERALSEALTRGCSGIVSFGTAGGLAPDLEPGTLIIADTVSGPFGPFGPLKTDEAWSARIVDALASPPLARVTRRGAMAGVAAPVKSEAEKRSLHSASGALAVDMESHIAGAIATARGLPFAVCRAVVDPAWRTLPPAATAGLRDDGTTTIGPILRELMRQPSQFGALLRLAGDARAAKSTLVQARHAFDIAGAFAFD
ncbi:Adenosylhopane nucleosidase, HpnG [Candidatus Burkholderia verschuerenii]|uniref:Adenosylhopane nucleosidase, HpnG n=1 Tax=Candidatus Burkholderia verschuerenii TaxID=242163 RepID=A0A0L0MI48_9BURK|nr:phosphorylase [Candidatus Burkholderia verschuerenii]KND62367.1 Adenosylhopane nucleosidase, HpnG [Candidatus Burkholderia verschuerenii]